MGITKYPEEFFTLLIYHFGRSIWDIVQYINSWIFHCCHEICDFEIQECIAAESEIYDFTIQSSADDIGESHTWATGASSLKDACSIHNDWFVCARRSNCCLFNCGTFVHTYLKGVDAIVQ